MQMFLSCKKGDKLFVIATENVTVMQNAKIHELKTIIKLINNRLTYLQYQKSKWVDITVHKSPKTAPRLHETLHSWKRITQ